ncbi:MAG: hypothetical protein M5R40_05205 [Anaerolineae bacterium]|nr:hypothetical protein [Anaerolineae bacterium]
MEAGIAVFRASASLDALMRDAFAEALGLPSPAVTGDALPPIYHIDPIPARELAARVRAQMGVDALRTSGDLDRAVRRVALLWGTPAARTTPAALRRSCA